VSTSTGRRRGRPPGGQPLADRDAILDAAERVIAREGSGASLDAVAAEAGVTKPTVYARVGQRAELANALATRLNERIVAATGAEVTSLAPSRRTLAVFFRTTLETIAEHRELFLYVTRGSADDSAERALYLAGQSAAPLAALLRTWQRHDGRDTSMVDAWAYAIIGMLNMVALWWIDQGELSGEQVADQLATLVWSGMTGAG
jgi:AcrR family transcriptional regulator